MNKSQRRLPLRAMVVLIPLVLTLASCGGGGGVSYDDPQVIADKLDCSLSDDSEEMFVNGGGQCPPYEVYTFANNEARDNYIKIGEQFGGLYVIGNGWAVNAKKQNRVKRVEEALGAD